MVRRAQEKSGAIGATEPLAAIGTESPSGVTEASGGGPSHGPSTRASSPRLRRARARPSTWPCTPPGSVRLYGQTRPMRTHKPYCRRSTPRVCGRYGTRWPVPASTSSTIATASGKSSVTAHAAGVGRVGVLALAHPDGAGPTGRGHGDVLVGAVADDEQPAGRDAEQVGGPQQAGGMRLARPPGRPARR